MTPDKLHKLTVKDKVWELLQMAHSARLLGNIAFNFTGRSIPCRDGWLPQSVFANPEITGSTEGKRRLRELRAEHNNSQWIFEMKCEHRRWYYRIRLRETPRPNPRQSRMTFAEV